MKETIHVVPKPILDAKVGNSLPVVYFCSVCSAGVAEVFTYPLDLIKTHLHLQGETAASFGSIKETKAGSIATAISIIRSQGPLTLYTGFLPMMMRHSAYSGIRLITYDFLRDKFRVVHSDGRITITSTGSICASALAGVCGAIPSNSGDIVKVRKQMEVRRKMLGLPPRFESIPKAFLEIIQNGGILALFKGLVPNMQRACLISIGEISGYDISKRYLLNHWHLADNFTTHTVASLTAGILATILSTPSDVLKSRIMNQPVDRNGRGLLYSGTMDCLIQTLRKDGPLALYKGFIPLCIRLGPSSLLFWISFEQFRKFFGGTSF